MRKFFTLKFNVNTYNPVEAKPTVCEFSTIKKEELVKAPDHCVESIMNFARSYRVADSKTTGKVEMILN